MEQSTYRLYHLIRALDRYATLERKIGVKVVTTDIYPLESGDASSPGFATLPGLAMVAGKEFPNLEVTLLDIRADEAQTVATTIAAEPFSARTAPISLRGGVRRERILESVELHDGPSRFRRGGVYLMIGGLGTVGRDTCRHLAHTYQAKLIIIGRSRLDEQRRQYLAEFEAAGSEVRYITADATKTSEIEDAVHQAKQTFGALHGVIHAAMVLVNRPIRQLSENELRTALETKVLSTFALLHALRSESLDFVLFYSSGVALEGNHGQAGYAAGCTFADAYALHEARTLPYPVRILNLGYWHSSGDEERERILRRVRAAGIKPLSAARGMAFVERALRSELPQLLTLDADPAILDNLGVRRNQMLVPSLTPLPQAMPKVRFAEEILSDRELADHQMATEELEHLSPHLLAASLAQLGLFEKMHEATTANEFAGHLGIIPQHRALFELQLEILVEAGFLRRQGTVIQLGERSIAQNHEQALHQLIARHPNITPLASLLQDCLSALPDVLIGGRDALDVLFPQGSPERVAAIYGGNPVSDLCNAELARLVLEQVEARRRSEPHRCVRVLEVGAGTGGTSAVVLDALRHHSEAVEYVFTDISPGFVRKGRARFAKNYPFTHFEVFDIEEDPSNQIDDIGSYDVVLATNVMHATHVLETSLRNMRRLLRGNGLLLLNEGTRALHQLSLVFGLAQGWWLFADSERRQRHSPLASERQWRDVLAESGFGHISSGAPRTQAGTLFQSVIAAVSDGLDEKGVGGRMDTTRSAFTPTQPPKVTARETAPTQRSANDALEQVTNVFALVLEMQSEQLDPDITFENYGIDSLVTMELTRGLEKIYGPLPSTLLFEQTTMRRIAEYCGGKATCISAAADRSIEVAPRTEIASTGTNNEIEDLDNLVASLPDAMVEQLLSELLPKSQTRQENLA
jgi:polyketide synthase PksN